MSHTKPTSSPNRTNFLAQPDTMSEDHQQLMAYISGRRMFKVVKGAMKKIGAGDLFKEFEQTLDIKLINKMKTTAAAKDRELTQAQRTTVNILLFGASGERAAVSVSVEPPRVMSPLAKHQQAPLERTSANKNGGVAQTDLKRKHAGVESMMDSSDDESDDESDDDSEDDDDDDEENFKNATQDATADEDDEYADALGDDDEIDEKKPIVLTPPPAAPAVARSTPSRKRMSTAQAEIENDCEALLNPPYPLDGEYWKLKGDGRRMSMPTRRFEPSSASGKPKQRRLYEDSE